LTPTVPADDAPAERREASTRDPNCGRRGCAEPLASPTRLLVEVLPVFRWRGFTLVVLALVGFALIAGACEESARFHSDPSASVAIDEEAATSTPEQDGAIEEATPTPAPPAIELSAAIAADKIAITVRGESLQGLELTLESRIDTTIRVVVNPATMFVPGASGTQTMVVIEKAVITLEPETKLEVELDVACAQMHDATPTSKDGFRIAAKSSPADLVKLLRIPAFGDESFRVKQFAIWTITDDPTKAGYVGLESSEFSGGPTSGELDRIAALFAEAGIPAGHYRALR
jgi:hypothetical protein